MSARRVTTQALRLAAAVACTATVLAAQDTPPAAWGRAHDAHGPLAPTAAAWLGGWSPLRPIADAPRGMARAPLAPGLLDAPAPIAGAFFLVGAPGALARDLTRGADDERDRIGFGDLRVRLAAASGSFRRPLDPAESSVGGVSGQGWAKVGSRGVAIGRFVVDREHLATSSFTARVTPYTASPFLSTDSVTPPMDRTRARLEGALGWELLGFGLGASAGLESREHSTTDFPLRRAGRSAFPAWSLGAERVLPWFDARIGVFARAMEPNETNILNPRPLPTIYYPVRGLDEPVSVPLSEQLFTREQRQGKARGITGAFSVFETDVVVTRESGSQAEDGVLGIQANPAVNRWRTSGDETRLQAQRAQGERLRLTVVGVDAAFDGAAERLDLEGIAYRASHGQRAIEADLRGQWGAWTAAVLGGASSTTRRASDFVAELALDLDVRQTFAAAEVARRFERAALALGVSGSSAAGAGSIPAVEEMLPVNQRLLAPMLAYEVAETRTVALWLTGTLRIKRSTLIGTVRREGAQATREVPELRQPLGARRGWVATVGLRY
jgi:hypothetical protein